MQIRAVSAALALAALAACGDSVSEQAVGGAAIGAGAAVVTSGSLVQGAALGAGANVLFCQLNPAKCD